jgi:hypothetical protein
MLKERRSLILLAAIAKGFRPEMTFEERGRTPAPGFPTCDRYEDVVEANYVSEGALKCPSGDPTRFYEEIQAAQRLSD